MTPEQIKDDFFATLAADPLPSDCEEDVWFFFNLNLRYPTQCSYVWLKEYLDASLDDKIEVKRLIREGIDGFLADYLSMYN